MTHTVRSGETLSRIAEANGITLAQLLDANPQFRANPNLIRVGDVLNIPGDQTGPIEPLPPTRPQPQPMAGRVLGRLSERFEVGRNGPGTVSDGGGGGDPGGVSYGSFQMNSRPNGGTVRRFVTQPDFPFRDNFRNLAPGGDAFSAEWRRIARTQREVFQRLQHDFIQSTHFDPLVRRIIRDDRLNVLTRSFTLQDVVWSTAVQHGVPRGGRITHRALGTLRIGVEDSQFDRSFIVAIYGERGRQNANGVLVHFTRSSPAVRRGVARRFRDEQRDALEMLAEEVAD